jgi:hypothetical protein
MPPEQPETRNEVGDVHGPVVQAGQVDQVTTGPTVNFNGTTTVERMFVGDTTNYYDDGAAHAQ